MDYKKVLKLHHINKLSNREIVRSCNCSKTTVNDFLRRFRDCPELSYPLPPDMTNEALEKLLYKKAGNQSNNDLYRDFDKDEVYQALSKKGETLKHLWRKYNSVGVVDGRIPLSYRQFCRRYSEWSGSKSITFHIQRQPGINIELDFAGKQLHIRDLKNPEVSTPVTVFVAALSYSGYFYAEGIIKCDIKNWIRVNNNALDYFGGVTPTVTPDNCKVAVIKNKDWINPVKNKDFQAWAEHNDTVITPAKIKSPRWKPVVEGHVKILSMHILTDLEDMTFYSLEELNRVLWKKVDEENRVNFAGLNYSRFDLFEKEEKEALLPLPNSKFEYPERKTVKVAQDFSFTFDKVHYTMPRKYLRQELEIRTGENKIFVYNKNGDLIRTHKRSYTPKSWVVIPSDMPAEYSDYGYWSVPYFQHKASRIGPNTQTLILGVVKRFNHPVQSFRSCFGILKLADRYSPQTLENCCRDAVIFGKFSYTYIANTIASYHTDVSALPKSPVKKTKNVLPTTGTYKDDDSGYTLSNLIKRQEQEGF